ncbi:hypothetical protein ACU4GI_33385 [Cupriavidus basilensis]
MKRFAFWIYVSLARVRGFWRGDYTDGRFGFRHVLFILSLVIASCGMFAGDAIDSALGVSAGTSGPIATFVGVISLILSGLSMVGGGGTGRGPFD